MRADLAPTSASSRKNQAPGNAPTREGLAGFPQSYFALVMATGIVSLALHDQGWDYPARILFAVNCLAYGVLWLLSLLRFIFHRRRWLADLISPRKSAGFLTMVAATCVLGSQFALQAPWRVVAIIFWGIGLGLWVALNYTFFAVITMREPKPSFETDISGSWLLAVVSTESLAVLGALVVPHGIGLFISLTTALVGTLLYVCLITLILHRWIFFSIKPEKLTPDYWINMGALAIITLATATLISAIQRDDTAPVLQPFLTGLLLLAWAAATWWIPLLVLAGVWRHLWSGVPYRYDPGYWSMVFPLGMYSAATSLVGSVLGLAFLRPLSALFAGIAALAWTVAFCGMLGSLVRRPATQENPR